MYPKIGIIIQARMGSSRLPGKVLKNLDNNTTVLGLQIQRLKISKKAHIIIIALPQNEENFPIIALAKFYEVLYYQGSEDDVLERYYLTAKKFDIDIIIRITSDCSFVDPYILDEMVDFYVDNKFEYVVNTISPTSNIPVGFDVEIFSFSTLEYLYEIAKNQRRRSMSLII